MNLKDKVCSVLEQWVDRIITWPWPKCSNCDGMGYNPLCSTLEKRVHFQCNPMKRRKEVGYHLPYRSWFECCICNGLGKIPPESYESDTTLLVREDYTPYIPVDGRIVYIDDEYI